MNKSEFIAKLDELMQLPKGTLQGNEHLEGLQSWDSITVMGYIALVNGTLKKRVAGKDVTSCKTVGELVSLAGVE